MTVALQGPLSLGFPRQEYWSGLPFPPPGDLPDSGMEPSFLRFLHGQVRSLLLSHLGPALPPPRHIRAREAADIFAVFSQIREILWQQSFCPSKGGLQEA